MIFIYQKLSLKSHYDLMATICCLLFTDYEKPQSVSPVSLQPSWRERNPIKSSYQQAKDSTNSISATQFVQQFQESESILHVLGK